MFVFGGLVTVDRTQKNLGQARECFHLGFYRRGSASHMVLAGFGRNNLNIVSQGMIFRSTGLYNFSHLLCTVFVMNVFNVGHPAKA